MVPTYRTCLTALHRVTQERDALKHEIDKVQHWQARAEAAEARIATARDEGLEDAALLIDSVQIPSAPLAAERFAAAIRLLKGTKT